MSRSIGSASDDQQDRAVAARDLLREAAIRVDGFRNGPVAALFGLSTGSRGALLKERRELAATQLHISASHLRTSKREAQLVEALADELYAADSAFRLRRRHRTEREREPGDSRLGIDWLDRHQAYRRVWTPVNAMQSDITVLLTYFRKNPSDEDIADRLMSITWRWAQFDTQLEQFITDYGGLWLLGDVEAEFAVADAVQRLEFLLPFGEADQSWIRLALKDSRHGELDPFMRRIKDDEVGIATLRAWSDWVRSCDCQLQEPDHERCRVHAWIAATTLFTHLLDKDWVKVADWYRVRQA